MELHLESRRAPLDADVVEWVRRSWSGTTIAVHGQVYDVATLDALIASHDDAMVGVLTFIADGRTIEIVSCDADPPGAGVGSALVTALAAYARETGAARLRCTTTNDNLRALGFWQSIGFRLVGLRPDAVPASRRLKPTIPARGYRGPPIRDELDLEMVVSR